MDDYVFCVMLVEVVIRLLGCVDVYVEMMSSSRVIGSEVGLIVVGVYGTIA